MQITNPILYQYIGTTFNREQSVNRLPSKPVTIEGQLLDDEEKKNSAQATQADSSRNDNSDNNSRENFALDNEQRQLIRPVAEPIQRNDVAAIQTYGFENFASGNSSLLNASVVPESGDYTSASASASTTADQGFPFGSRKSFQGVAGNSLVIQNYLSNTPEQLNRSGDFNSASVDFFV